MHNFKNSVFMSKKKRRIRSVAFLGSFRLRPIIVKKIYSQQWGDLNKNTFFFAPRLSNLSPVLNKLMQLACHSRWAILRQKIPILGFNAILITFHTFLKPYD